MFYDKKKVFVKEQHVPEENEIDNFEEISYHIIGYTKMVIRLLPLELDLLKKKLGKVERVAIIKEHRGLGYGKPINELY